MKPAILCSKTFSLRAVYSRTLSSARIISKTLAADDLYYSDDDTRDSASKQVAAGSEGKTVHDLLLRTDVHAVVIALPITKQPAYVRLALSAGKHVLSEKPIAADVTTARELIDWYYTSIRHRGLIWSVAENYRFLDAFQIGQSLCRRLGALESFELTKHWMQERRYLETPYVYKHTSLRLS